MLGPYIAMTEGAEQVKLCFRFQVNGTSDPDFLYPANMSAVVTDVTRAGAAGVFAVQLGVGHRWPGFVGGGGYVLGDDGVSLGLAVQTSVADYVPSTGVLTLRTVDPYTDATPAAVDPTDNDWVYVELCFQRREMFNTSVAI